MHLVSWGIQLCLLQNSSFRSFFREHLDPTTLPGDGPAQQSHERREKDGLGAPGWHPISSHIPSNPYTARPPRLLFSVGRCSPVVVIPQQLSFYLGDLTLFTRHLFLWIRDKAWHEGEVSQSREQPVFGASIRHAQLFKGGMKSYRRYSC